MSNVRGGLAIISDNPLILLLSNFTGSRFERFTESFGVDLLA